MVKRFENNNKTEQSLLFNQNNVTVQPINHSTIKPKYALALVNIKGLGVKTFSYLIPDEMKDKIQIGQAILVPFGRQGLLMLFAWGFRIICPKRLRRRKSIRF